jgi:cyclic beta-1,2-glucan synthetase
MFRLGVEAILGLRQTGQGLVIDPVIPRSWPGFTAEVRRAGTLYRVAVENPKGVARGVARIELDGQPVAGGVVPWQAEGGEHHVRVRLGPVETTPARAAA